MTKRFFYVVNPLDGAPLFVNGRETFTGPFEDKKRAFMSKNLHNLLTLGQENGGKYEVFSQDLPEMIRVKGNIEQITEVGYKGSIHVDNLCFGYNLELRTESGQNPFELSSIEEAKRQMLTHIEVTVPYGDILSADRKLVSTEKTGLIDSTIHTLFFHLETGLDFNFIPLVKNVDFTQTPSGCGIEYLIPRTLELEKNLGLYVTEDC